MAVATEIALALSYNEFIQEKGLLMCSECPGWLCYSLKQQYKVVCQYYSKIQSPMQIQYQLLASLFKEQLPYIVFVMPCYDKKIEVALFKLPNSQVITTADIFKVLSKPSKTLTYFDNEIEKYFSDIKYEPKGLRGLSNGYIEYIAGQCMRKGYSVKKIAKSPSSWEGYEVEIEGKKRRLLYVSGFKDIQRMLRQLKQGKFVNDYIEIMACPLGCMSGLGQMVEFYDAKYKWPCVPSQGLENSVIPFEISKYCWDPTKFEIISKSNNLDW